ncbi:MAG: UDP-N-acetylmuramoyl-tripeptide--D-alanyl-D-alanine ligase, partial [Firmicutes bacterium]|nr:UDP-N-acetylmuramoyl-tripeptide--D-alanyl-D-alanine ligase [Bacillota bacterium]
MIHLMTDDIVKATEGEISGNKNNTEISGISTDTRTIEKGQLFVAIRGDNFDGHKFLDMAHEKGAAAIITEEDFKADCAVIKVKDSRKALGDIAKYYIGLFSIPVVAITGSVGKTTTKDMISSVLSEKYNVLKTDGNFNNDIGVPLTIFRLEERHTAAVIEMGMNHFGEISKLTRIAKPDIAVITNVGVSHIENLGSREGILKAKCEIFEGLKENGTKI